MGATVDERIYPRMGHTVNRGRARGGAGDSGSFRLKPEATSIVVLCGFSPIQMRGFRLHARKAAAVGVHPLAWLHGLRPEGCGSSAKNLLTSRHHAAFRLKAEATTRGLC